MAYTEGYCPKCGQTGDLCNHDRSMVGTTFHFYSGDLQTYCTLEQIDSLHQIVSIIERGKRLCKKGAI